MLISYCFSVVTFEASSISRERGNYDTRWGWIHVCAAHTWQRQSSSEWPRWCCTKCHSRSKCGGSLKLKVYTIYISSLNVKCDVSSLLFFLSERLPIPAYILALTFFGMSLVSMAMLVGLRLRRTKLLLSWVLMNAVTICPEAGMVLFMAIYHWVSFPISFPLLQQCVGSSSRLLFLLRDVTQPRILR